MMGRGTKLNAPHKISHSIQDKEESRCGKKNSDILFPTRNVLCTCGNKLLTNITKSVMFDVVQYEAFSHAK